MSSTSMLTFHDVLKKEQNGHINEIISAMNLDMDILFKAWFQLFINKGSITV